MDPLPLGGHIIVGEEATLLLLLAGGIRVDGEVLVVQLLRMLGGTVVGPIPASPIRTTSELHRRVLGVQGSSRIWMGEALPVSGERGWGFDLEIETRNV
jgi:hypothetical protein